MKSYGLMAFAAIALTSCASMTQTSKTAGVESSLLSATVADLKVGDRVSAELNVNKPLRRGGMTNICHAVEAEALAKAGNADVLLEPQYVIEKKTGLFGSKVTKISVTGRPATYQNFRNFSDSVWINPAFRGSVASQFYASNPSRKTRALYASKERRERDEYVARPRRFTALLNVFAGLNMPRGGEEYTLYEDWDCTGFSCGGTLGVGYQFTPQIYAGVGGGVSYSGELDDFIYPVFVQGRYYLKPKRKSLFVDLKIGSFFGNYDECENADSHFYVSPSIGYTFGRFELALQYQYISMNTEDYYRSDVIKLNLKNHDINLSFGFRF